MNVPRTIFYVDDDWDDLDILQDTLSTFGQKATLFKLGDDLLKQLNDPPPVASIVFLDINMPHKTGLDILKDKDKPGS